MKLQSPEEVMRQKLIEAIRELQHNSELVDDMVCLVSEPFTLHLIRDVLNSQSPWASLTIRQIQLIRQTGHHPSRSRHGILYAHGTASPNSIDLVRTQFQTKNNDEGIGVRLEARERNMTIDLMAHEVVSLEVSDEARVNPAIATYFITIAIDEAAADRLDRHLRPERYAGEHLLPLTEYPIEREEALKQLLG